ncbi:LacI family DNA-binding transcriptional regulator [Bacillus sp. EB106-08-02-XG196]|jgi:LacI family transcriptional regulator, sucrose operon repressor|uniref:LacI family DNA-binding transcriptional regulator n=1 Tax=Bacillus sp. EB106-08-02-XG196 TaxID=2737049 RepID=UPI0015C48A46|nr:LacI family DNA-binding transcriptional regulator [Bacillus sp. EB106-08-02-XG196]NWQ43641.1 LacI family DNA-binding transcriptional regulator [Bacillus sp. EB106-08-02-XG196]
MSSTILDIAKLAGVAKSTVSRFLNGGSVGEATKKKIERAIKETGYSPNPFAQSLKAKKTNIIGTIVPRLDSFAASQTLIGIDEQLKKMNYQMLISNTSQSLEREIESIYSFANQKMAGIILLATEITDQHIQAFESVKVPVLLIGQEHENFHSLIHDDFNAGYAMGRYVLEKGYRKIAYLGVTERDISVGVNRKQGFKKVIQEVDDCDVRFYETLFNIPAAQASAKEIIHEFQPSIFVCATDNIALGVLKASYSEGITIPQDLAVTGFGGYDVTGIIHPGITTAKFFYKEAGETAARHIVELVNERPVEKVTVSKFEIIERESVDNLFNTPL